MNSLTLRNVDFPFSLLSTYSNKRYVEIDEEDSYEEYERSEIYINTDKNISIMVEQFRDEEEDFFDDCTEIMDCISTEAYDSLVEYMNSHSNFTVYWSQVYGTTSDYTIIENRYLDTIEEIREAISHIEYDERLKYLIATKSTDGLFHAKRFVERG